MKRMTVCDLRVLAWGGFPAEGCHGGFLIKSAHEPEETEMGCDTTEDEALAAGVARAREMLTEDPARAALARLVAAVKASRETKKTWDTSRNDEPQESLNLKCGAMLSAMREEDAAIAEAERALEENR